MKNIFLKLKNIPFEHKIGLVLSLITTLSAIAGLYLIVNAAQSLHETKNADQGNFILTLQRDFYTNDKMTAIRKAFEENKKIFKDNGGEFDTEDVDTYIGFFATLDSLIERGILDYNLVDDNFGYFIKQTYDNQEVKDYIKYLQTHYGKDVDQGFVDLGSQISKEGY